MLLHHPASSVPFKQWLLHTRENRKFLLFALGIVVLQFVWLKVLYPFPNFMIPDSISYIEAASKNQNINIWPIGYSRFLRIFSCFSDSHFVLVLFQYLLLQASILYLLFTVRYWLLSNRILFVLLLALSTANPLIGHISNFVSSDALFTAISLVWFTQLIQIIYRPTNRLLITHAVVILLAVMVRNYALYYPFISALVILFTKLPAKVKWGNIGLMVLLLVLFNGYTRYNYYQLTGRAQNPAFAGWMMAANALYGYAHAETQAPESVPERFRQLHILVNRHMDSLRWAPHRPDEDISIYYQWDEHSPLVQYMNAYRKGDTTVTYFNRWSAMGPLYLDYGRYLIGQHPFPYYVYYLQTNAEYFLKPPARFMEDYNSRRPVADPAAVAWFGWKNNQLPSAAKDNKIIITQYFPMVIAIINGIYLFSFIGFVFMIGFKQSFSFGRGIAWWSFTAWLANLVFSIFSAPVELRYQIFSMVCTLIFEGVFIHFIIQASQAEIAAHKSKQKSSSPIRETVL